MVNPIINSIYIIYSLNKVIRIQCTLCKKKRLYSIQLDHAFTLSCIKNSLRLARGKQRN